MIRSDTTAIAMIQAKGGGTAIPKMLSAEKISVPFFALFLTGVQSSIVRELLELRRLIG